MSISGYDPLPDLTSEWPIVSPVYDSMHTIRRGSVISLLGHAGRDPPNRPAGSNKNYRRTPAIVRKGTLMLGNKLEHPRDCECLGRRNFLKMTGIATAFGFAGGGLF